MAVSIFTWERFAKGEEGAQISRGSGVWHRVVAGPVGGQVPRKHGGIPTVESLMIARSGDYARTSKS